MPITINFTTDGEGVILTSVAALSGEELLVAIRQVFADQRYPSLRYWIADHSACDQFLVNLDHLKEITSLNKVEGLKNPGMLLSLVAPKDHPFAVSRQFEVLDDGSGFLTHVFRDRPSANAWIAQQLENKTSKTD